jgi:hypothetical protein
MTKNSKLSENSGPQKSGSRTKNISTFTANFWYEKSGCSARKTKATDFGIRIARFLAKIDGSQGENTRDRSGKP